MLYVNYISLKLGGGEDLPIPPPSNPSYLTLGRKFFKFFFGNSFKFTKQCKNKNSTRNTCIPFTQIHFSLTFYPISFIIWVLSLMHTHCI